MRNYYTAYPDKPGLPAWLEAWLKAYKDNEDLKETKENYQAIAKLEDSSKRWVARRK